MFAAPVGRQTDILTEYLRFDCAAVGQKSTPNTVGKRQQYCPAESERMNAHEVAITPVQLFRGVLEGWRVKHIDFTQPRHKCANLEQVHSSSGKKSGLQELWIISDRRFSGSQEDGLASADEWRGHGILSH